MWQHWLLHGISTFMVVAKFFLVVGPWLLIVMLLLLSLNVTIVFTKICCPSSLAITHIGPLTISSEGIWINAYSQSFRVFHMRVCERICNIIAYGLYALNLHIRTNEHIVFKFSGIIQPAGNCCRHQHLGTHLLQAIWVELIYMNCCTWIRSRLKILELSQLSCGVIWIKN